MSTSHHHLHRRLWDHDEYDQTIRGYVERVWRFTGFASSASSDFLIFSLSDFSWTCTILSQVHGSLKNRWIIQVFLIESCAESLVEFLVDIVTEERSLMCEATIIFTSFSLLLERYARSLDLAVRHDKSSTIVYLIPLVSSITLMFSWNGGHGQSLLAYWSYPRQDRSLSKYDKIKTEEKSQGKSKRPIRFLFSPPPLCLQV